MNNEIPSWTPLRKQLKEEIKPQHSLNFNSHQNTLGWVSFILLAVPLEGSKSKYPICSICPFIFTTQNTSKVQSLYSGFTTFIFFLVIRFLEGLLRQMFVPAFTSALDILVPPDSWKNLFYCEWPKRPLKVCYKLCI